MKTVQPYGRSRTERCTLESPLELFARFVQTLLLIALALSTGLVSVASTATLASTPSTTATATASSSSSVAVVKPSVILSILLRIID